MTAPAAIRLMGDFRISTQLHTQVVLPAGAGPHPVLLVRTPYSTSSHMAEAFSWAAKGVGSVIQDVRGRYESGGRWQPYVNEGLDGCDTLAWIKQQPWSDGRVIAYGSSYGAHCAVELARLAGDHLWGVVVTVPALSLAHTIREPSGVPRLFAHAWWWSSQGDQSTTRGPILDALLRHRPDVLRHLPVAELPESLGVDLPGFADAWETSRDGWTAPGMTSSGRVNTRVSVPPLIVLAGLYDVYCDDAVELWRQWPNESARLLINTWQHDLGLKHRDRNGARPRQRAHQIPAVAALLGWVMRVLDGEAPAGRVGLSAVESCQQWRSVPPTEQGQTHLELSVHRSDFVADPSDPHPSAMGPAEVGDLMARSDCALLTTDPFLEDLDLIGTLTVELGQVHAALPDGVQLDWAIRVIECRSNGKSVQLGHGIIRTADRTNLRISIPRVSQRVRFGSHLAVQVSGHQFPLYPRDGQRGEDALRVSELHPLTRSVEAPAHIRVCIATGTASDLTVDELIGELLK
ncbi:CocE/NonD family hydrolase [Nakamurella antarctica]|uniref:CocE/NonD family hydrolase n=1 Tax=Nakamurella antarctica TaxID=1902245 RepID=A0A3G8ZNZ2_9ACTN|nr:CocE/NonD family hydrolase [Nakamurella antarctica]AZI58970.1 CocE/NonD family hydrolase [Nakamurella antarctica]